MNIELAEQKYGEFLSALGFDWESDPNMRETPKRVAKMMVSDIFKGHYSESPKITVFENVNKYSGIVFQGNTEVKSMCSHHFLPFDGVAHIAYLPGEKIIGLSKLNRIVDFFSRRPQVQENLTSQIHEFLDKVLEGNQGVAVYIEAKHLCVSHRGIRQNSTMKTTKLSGAFLDSQDGAKQEFFNYISDLNK